jgi:hypothetical protein
MLSNSAQLRFHPFNDISNIVRLKEQAVDGTVECAKKFLAIQRPHESVVELGDNERGQIVESLAVACFYLRV